MPHIALAAAQVACRTGDIQHNSVRHLQLIELAAAAQIDLLVFPELSLTGYDLPLAASLALTPDDAGLSCFSLRARQHRMTIVVGAPLRLTESGPVYIGALIFSPDGGTKYYTKQHLHADEVNYVKAGNGAAALVINAQRISLAICADTNHPQHARQAARSGSSIYAAGVLVGEQGYAADTANLRGYAKKYGMTVLMANHASPTGGWAPAGKSAIWSPQGEPIAAADDRREQLVVAYLRDARWSGNTLRA